ncbi:MAG TPA: hypothetical protein VN081_04730 [Dongiaceae bacterium]|nr:hypothetical protein [Dongiaceae bacterium]
MSEPNFNPSYDVNLQVRQPYFKSTDVGLSEKTGRVAVKPELKPFFETPYFQRQKVRARLFESVFKDWFLDVRCKHVSVGSREHVMLTFDRIQVRSKMFGVTIKKRQWKNFIKLMKGGYGRPMNIEEKHAYAHKLTRRGYSMTTVVTALNACKALRT